MIVNDKMITNKKGGVLFWCPVALCEQING